MRNRWFLVLGLMAVITGCVQQPASVPVIGPATTVHVDAQGTSDFTVVKKGVTMGVITWNAKVKNSTTSTAVRLVIDCLDSKGKIIAEDDKDVIVPAGQVLTTTGTMDVPTTVIQALDRVDAYLVLDNDYKRNVAP